MTGIATTAYHLAANEGPALWHLGGLLTFKATGDTTGGRMWVHEARGADWPCRRIRYRLGCWTSKGAGEQFHSVTAASAQRTHGDDRFRQRLSSCEKRAEDAGLSRKRSLQTNKCQYIAH